MSSKIKLGILIVDDHPIVRDGIARLLEISGKMRVCGETGDGKEVMELIEKTRPDAMILDLMLDSSDGLALMGQIKSRYPELPVLILSVHDESTHALRCLQAGARGYLMKKMASREILTALCDIMNGNVYLSDRVKQKIANSFVENRINDGANSIELLSNREFQIFRLYGQGLQTAYIAEKLQCSPKTVETHCLRIRRKMNLKNINELIAIAGAFIARK